MIGTLLLSLNSRSNRLLLFGTPCDAATGQVIWRHLHCNLIAGQNANEVHPQLSGDVSQDHMAIGKLYLSGNTVVVTAR